METDHEYMVVKTSRGLKHVPIESLAPSPTTIRKNENKRLFISKVTAIFDLGSNDKFNIARASKLFETIKKVDKQAVICPLDDPKYRIYFIRDMPSDEATFKSIFKPEIKYRGKQIQIVFMLESDFKVSDIKRDPSMLAYLNQEPKTYFREHNWTSTKIVSVGMFTNKHYIATYRKDYQEKIQNFIAEAIKNEPDEMKDDISTSTERANNNATDPSTETEIEPFEIPRIEVNTTLRSYYKRDEDGNKTGKPVRSMVLNVRCEMHQANRVEQILYDNRDKLDPNEFGLFMSYNHARINNELYGDMLRQNNSFHLGTKIVTLFGLHEEVLHGKNINLDDEKEYNGYSYLNGHYISVKYGEDKEECTTVIHSIERTLLSEELGKWFFVINDEMYRQAYDAIDQVIDDWRVTDAYEQHENDNESFRKGIRYENNPSSKQTNLDSFKMHEDMLRSNFSYYEDASLDTVSTSNSSNKRKKPTTVQFEYSTHEFPEFRSKPFLSATLNAWEKKPKLGGEPDESVTSKSQESKSLTNPGTIDSLSEFQSIFDSQMLEMKSFVVTKTEEVSKSQKVFQEKILEQNQQLLNIQNLLASQEERHQKEMSAIMQKMEQMSSNFETLLKLFIDRSNTNKEEEVEVMEITPKTKKRERSLMNTIFSMAGATKPDDSEEEFIVDNTPQAKHSGKPGGTRKFDLPPLG